MATGDVDINLKDGGLGGIPQGQDGVHLKLGEAEGGIVNKIYSVGSFFEAKSVLLKGPLLDAIEQWYKEFSKEKKQKPPKLFFVRPNNDVAGHIGVVTKTGTGLATNATGGTATGSRSFIVEIIVAGASGVATYRKSLDGGVTWSPEITTPASATPIVLDAGVTIAFTDDGGTPENSFVSGDKYEFSCVAPTASTSSILTALDAAKQVYNIRFVHILGESDFAFWTSIGVVADDWDENYHNPQIFLLEATARDAESVEQWVLDRINEAVSFVHKRIVISGLQVMNTVTNTYVNIARVLSAKTSIARVNESPGYVELFASLTATEIRDWAELSKKQSGGDVYLDLLDDNRYTVTKIYDNYPGIFFSHVNLLSTPTSDFQRIQDMRTADKVRRITRSTIMKYLEGPANSDTGRGGIQSLIVDVDNAVSQKMELAGQKEIAKHETDIDPNQDIAGTGEVVGVIHIYKIGTMEKISIDVGYSKE